MTVSRARRALLRTAGCAWGTGLAALGWPARAQPAATAGFVWQTPDTTAAQPLFALPLIDLDGQAVVLAKPLGRPLLVNFWARWCGPCKVEIPELVALHARRTGVDIVGLALEQNPEAVRDFARAYEINYPVRLARSGALELMRQLGNARAGLPFTVLIDRRAALVATRLGPLDRIQLETAVQRVLS